MRAKISIQRERKTVSILNGQLLDLGLGLGWPQVRPNIKFSEKVDEDDSLEHVYVKDGARNAAVRREEPHVDGVDQQDHELGQLDQGDVLLPPEAGLHAGVLRRQEVVEVHDHVHEGVEEGQGVEVAPGAVEPAQDIAAQDHEDVVVDVEEGDLLVALPQDEEHGVQQIDDLVEDVGEVHGALQSLVLVAMGEALDALQVADAPVAQVVSYLVRRKTKWK